MEGVFIINFKLSLRKTGINPQLIPVVQNDMRITKNNFVGY